MLEVEDPKKEPIIKEKLALLKVLGASVGTALLLIFLLVSNWGLSAREQLVNAVLLAPNMLTKISFQDIDNRTGLSDLFIVDRLEYRYQDADGKWESLYVTPAEYREFYQVISNDKILNSALVPDPSTPFVSQFMIRVKPQSQVGQNYPDTPIFQQIQFLKEGGFYRISLREGKNKGSWVYFQHPKVKAILDQIVVPKGQIGK